MIRPSVRIALFVVTTLVAVVLLLRYPTSRPPGTADVAQAASDPLVGIVAAPDPSTTDSDGTTGAGAGAGAGATVVNGPVVGTRWGNVQVQAVIADGRLTEVTPLQYPQGNGRDRQINAYALPELRDRVLAAQSADVDVVTGATVTSEGYLSSLQAALDLAHFG